MKTRIILTIVTISLSISLYGQRMGEGTNFLSIGIGPRSSYHKLNTKGTPAIRLSFDHGIKKVGPGVITAGGGIGFFADHYNSSVSWVDLGGIHSQAYKKNWMYVLAAVRVGYFYNLKELGMPKLNAWAGITSGARFRIYSDDFDGPANVITPDDSGIEFHPGAFGGASYFVTEKIALFTEFGVDFSPFTAGVTIHL